MARRRADCEAEPGTRHGIVAATGHGRVV